MGRFDNEKRIKGQAQAAGRRRPPRYKPGNVCRRCGCTPHADNCPTLRGSNVESRNLQKQIKEDKKKARELRKQQRKDKKAARQQRANERKARREAKRLKRKKYL